MQRFIAVAVVALVLITAFVLWERKAAEPILPPNLYHIVIFRVSTSVSFLLAMIMFGAIISVAERPSRRRGRFPRSGAELMFASDVSDTWVATIGPR